MPQTIDVEITMKSQSVDVEISGARGPQGSPGGSAARFTVAPYGSNIAADYIVADEDHADIEITEAIEAANALPNGGVVELLDGDFRTSITLLPLNNVWLRGQGMFGQTRIIPVNNNYGMNFQVNTPDDPLLNFQMTDIELDGSLIDRAVYSKGIHGTDYTNTQWKRLYIHDFTASGLGIDFPRNSVIDSCLVSWNGYINKRTITAASWSSNTLTFTTSTAHGMVAPVKASGTLTASGTMNDGDTVTIADIVYTFKTTLTGASFEVAINGSVANALTNFQKAVNLTGVAGTDYGTGTELHPTVTISAVTATTATLTAKSFGSGSNSINTTETGSNLSFGGSTLSGGVSGNVVVITGMMPQGYNGNYAISSVPTATTFTITSTNNGSAPQSFSLTSDPGTATTFGFMSTSGSQSPFGYNGIGIGCNENYDESLICTNNVCIGNLNNNYLIENDGVITDPNESSSFIFANNLSYYAGQVGYRVTGTPHGKFVGNHDYGSYIGARFTADISTKSITAGSWSGGVATLTSSTDHNFTVGDRIGLSGAIPSAYNGYYTVLSTPTSTTFTVDIDSDPGTFLHVGTASRLGRTIEGASFNDAILDSNTAFGVLTSSQSIGLLINDTVIKNCVNEGVRITAGYTQINGGRIFNNGRSGVQITGPSGATTAPLKYVDIGSVLVYNNGQNITGSSGITVSSTSTNKVSNLRIHDVQSFDDQDTKTQAYGVNFNGIVLDSSISDSDLSNNLTASLSMDAGSTVSVSNVTGVNPQTFIDLGSTISGSVTFDVTTGNVFKAILSGDITAVMPTAPVEGSRMTWMLKQPDTGGPYIMTLPANTMTAGPLRLSTTASVTDVITWIYRAGNTNKWVEESRAIHDTSPRVKTLTSVAAVYTPNADIADIVLINSPGANFTVDDPTGTFVNGQRLEIRIASSSTGRTPTWGSTYASGRNAVLPTTALPASTTLYFMFEYDSVLAKWVLISPNLLARITSITSSATPTINTNACDAVTITALATDITSMTTNLSGNPMNFQKLIIRIKDNGTARAITWGASFEAKGVALPTTTVISKVLTVGFIYDSVTLKWGAVALAQEA